MKKTGYRLTKKQKEVLAPTLQCAELFGDMRMGLMETFNEAAGWRERMEDNGLRARDVAGYEVWRDLETAARKADDVLCAWFEQCKEGGAE